MLLNSESSLARYLRTVGVPPPWPLLIVIFFSLSALLCVAGLVWLERRRRQPRRRPKGETILRDKILLRRADHWSNDAVRKKKKKPRAADSEHGSESTTASLPHGWEMVRDERGRDYYWSTRLRRATWTRPHELRESATLPSGWEEYDDDNGRKFYYNRRQRSTTWTHPLADDRLDDDRLEDVNDQEEKEPLPARSRGALPAPSSRQPTQIDRACKNRSDEEQPQLQSREGKEECEAGSSDLRRSWAEAVRDLTASAGSSTLSGRRHSGFDRLVSLGSAYGADI